MAGSGRRIVGSGAVGQRAGWRRGPTRQIRLWPTGGGVEQGSTRAGAPCPWLARAGGRRGGVGVNAGGGVWQRAEDEEDVVYDMWDPLNPKLYDTWDQLTELNLPSILNLIPSTKQKRGSEPLQPNISDQT
jgi:hypothetical protein